MIGGRWRAGRSSVVVFGLGVVFVACRGATEIALDVRTNVDCTNAASWKGVAVYVGEPGLDVESKAPALTSTSCDTNGQIGSLVVVPTGSESGQVGIRVVAGLTRNPEDCSAANYDGCIVARRTLEYLPHESQTVVIDLTADCAGNGCDVNHTCVEGACTDTVIAAPPVGADGGVFSSGPTVRCGDDGTRCPANDSQLACCMTTNHGGDASTPNTGSCLAPPSCPATNAILYCDDSSECGVTDAGEPMVCCETVNGVGSGAATSGNCVPSSHCSGGLNLVFCENRQACPSNQDRCATSEQLNGYFDCFN